MNVQRLKILLLSTIYPRPTGNKGTSVCHYFAKEWSKMGYTVRVIHIQSVYPAPFYWAARLLNEVIAARTGAVVYTHRDKTISKYEMDGIPIMRIPMFKRLPHRKYSSKVIIKAISDIVADNMSVDFVPDIIVGHFPNPQIEIVGTLREQYYPLAKTAIVMHGDNNQPGDVYGKRCADLITKIDVWGFRSKAIQQEFESLYGRCPHNFICYSGVPESYISPLNLHQFDKQLYGFIYVGEMIERKYPLCVMDALQKVYPNGDYHLSYVGEGKLLKNIRQRVTDKHLERQVSVLGGIPRTEIIRKYDEADCMVMISRAEAYGLVYLEAMSRGCITIASRNEGFDGVIIDGVNGFLCEAGNIEELVAVIIRINALSPKERLEISNKAIETAKKLTDYNAAKMYIEDVINP